jgi:hypothetical protein
MLATGISIPKWSMRFLQIESPTRLRQPMASTLRLAGGQLTGTVTNSLPFPLRNCHVVSKWNHTSLGDMLAGETRQFSLNLRVPTGPLPFRADPNTYLSSSIVFSKDLWRPDAFSKGEREFLDTVVNGWSGMFGQPVLVGWGEPVAPPPVLAGEQHSVRQMHFYAFRLGLPQQGRQIEVPPSTSALHGASGTLGPPEEGERESWERTQYEQALEFDMPFMAARVRTDELQVHAHFSAWSPDSPSFRTSVWLADWQGRRWERIARDVTGRLDISVPNPSRFVKLPEGLVRIKIDSGRGYFPGKTDWLDLSFKGKRL